LNSKNIFRQYLDILPFCDYCIDVANKPQELTKFKSDPMKENIGDIFAFKSFK
jgi:hypothetical protein